MIVNIVDEVVKASNIGVLEETKALHDGIKVRLMSREVGRVKEILK